MNVFDFVTQDEIDDLSEDPHLAFMTFVRHAQRRLNEYTRELGSDQDDWYLRNEAQYGFQNVVIAAAKRFGIEPFVSLSVPRIDDYNQRGSEDYRQFKADLDHYMTQLIIDNSIRGRHESVILASELKDRIRTYIHGLKTAIDQSEFPESKRATLFKKLTEFEKELEKRRLNLLAVTKLLVSIMAVPGALWASYDIVSRLTGNILQAVGEAKAADDENRQLPPTEQPAALLPPREERVRGASLDDEVPF